MENLLKENKEHGFEEYTENVLIEEKKPCPKKEGNTGCCAKEKEGILIKKSN